MKLAEVIRDWTANGYTGELVLAHMGELRRDDETTVVGSEKFGKKNKPDPEALARRFERAARADAETRGGSQRYRLAWFRSGGRPTDTHAFLVEASPVDDVDGSAKSLAKEAMRQSRRLHEIVVRVSEGTAALLARTNHETEEQMAKMRDHINGQYLLMAKTVAELVERQDERKLEAETQASREKRKDELLGILRGLVPTLLAAASGSTALTEIWRSLDAPKRELLLEHLDEKQTKLLFEAVELDGQAETSKEHVLGAIRHLHEGPTP